MSWTAGSRRDHGSGTGLKSRALFHPCTGVTAEKRPAGRGRQGPRHGAPAPVRGAGGRGPVRPGRSHRGGRRLAPGYPFDGTIAGAKLSAARSMRVRTGRGSVSPRSCWARTAPSSATSASTPHGMRVVRSRSGTAQEHRHRRDPGAGRVGAAPVRCDRGARGDGSRAGRPLPDRRAAPGRGSCSSIARSPEQHRDLCPAAPRDEGQQDTEDGRGDQVPETSDRRRSR
jgi:hypothetical protein